jgi:ferric-dicitrate binding protein FerR (iron transport regulator)
VQLTDGTVISISPNSNLVVDKGFGKKNRTLHLKGAADFSVVHQEKLPFIVDAGDVFIKDIGTKFSIKSSADTDTVYVRVDEGVVLLFDSLGSSLEIKATGKALYIRSIKKIVSEVTEKKISAAVQFSNSSLEEVILKLNSIYDTEITVENVQLNKCTITTQFDKENLETVLGIITETLGLSYEKTSSGYLIKGQSCQPQ